MLKLYRSDFYCDDAYGYIYITYINNIESEFNNCFYIGQRLVKRDKKYPNKTYYGSGSKINNYIKKWGTFGLNKIIIAFADDKDELDRLEYESIFPELGKKNCLNLRDGGMQGLISNETRKKISNSKKGKTGRKKTPEEIEFCRQINLGRKLSDETKQKISLSKKGTPSWNKGRKATEEEKKKLSISHMGKPSPRKGKKYGKWYNNGIKSVICDECPEGYKLGRLRRKDNYD